MQKNLTRSANITFGTDGWRAIIGQDYTFDHVALLVQAYCDLQKKQGNSGQIVIGYDRRFNSQAFAEKAAEVLMGNGFSVLLSDDYCPTPAVSWMVKETQSLAGIVITASHNPFQWNGVKFKENYGGSASPEYCQKIESQLLENTEGLVKLISLNKAKEKSLLNYFSAQEKYSQALAQYIDLDKIKQSGIKILVDSMYGAGSAFIKQLLPDQTIEMRAEDNPAFPRINPEPILKNMAATVTKLKNIQADLALATDGDADRIGALDEQGNFVSSHQIFSLILRHLIQVKNKRGSVIKTVSTTSMIDRIAGEYGLELDETPIGFKHICQKFLSGNVLMGGEESGGIGICDHVYERDGLLNGLLLAEIVAHHQKPLSKIIAELQKQFGPLEFIREDLKFEVEQMQKIRSMLNLPDFNIEFNQSIQSQSDKDGLKYFLDDGSWLLLRASGTEPLIRVYAEAKSKQVAQKLVETGKRALIKINI